MPTTTSNDDGIDAYMEEQEGEPNGAPLNSTSKHGQIDPETKLEIIDKLLKTPMDQGQTWYLVASQWYKRWHKVCTGEVDKEGEVTEDDLGPVDNSPLVDLNGILVQTAMEHADVEFVPEEAWHLFVKW